MSDPTTEFTPGYWYQWHMSKVYCVAKIGNYWEIEFANGTRTTWGRHRGVDLSTAWKPHSWYASLERFNK